MKTGINLLAMSGMISLAIAVLHLIIIYYGAPAYRYFGAGETMATMAANGSLLPAMVTLGVTIVFLVFSAYGFAAAGYLTLPYTFAAMFAIGAIYTLRGLTLFPMLFMAEQVSKFDVVTSLISLAIGLLHFAGLFWNKLAASV